MPGPTVAALAAPIRRVQQLVGPGWSGVPASDPAAELDGVRAMLAEVAGSASQAWRRTGDSWSGDGADAAAAFATSTASAIDAAAERAGGLGVVAADAAAAVARAHRRLQHIVEDFEARATALEPHLDSPGVARELLTEARDALARAIAVVEELSAELDGQAAAVEASAATAPAGFSSGGAAPGVSAPAAGAPAVGSPGFGAGPGALGAGGLGGGGFAEPAAFTRPDGAETPDAASFGEGVAVRLPDGTVVMAPNAIAAGAVRHALTQLGVPYQWGGTTPGVGLDCSGLTQWAYREAGLDLPRLAQEQDIGRAVAAGALLPGDLAVWDGHVAMIVGNGIMVEAGDPVQLSPVRTANAGQGFQGFWRPTA
ncbi:C40 family peptidase [Mycobacterium sp. ITM-2016-00317]|uniref:C40 family peptidase n=1 Tax=Mycobacterium sp. ITM-2016-00317 TaxID=2099694 RepID=UPI00287F724F|nr:C40 family peptidase [Mycobacterium sp. ITM-2016-00317]WNG88880.1 C40 family peptidase [Mycobacterium sp. ITM-2016-00317]